MSTWLTRTVHFTTSLQLEAVKMLAPSLLVAMSLSLTTAAAGFPPQVRVEVRTSSGPVVGRVNGTRYETACAFFPATKILPSAAVPDVAAFLGIPYGNKALHMDASSRRNLDS